MAHQQFESIRIGPGAHRIIALTPELRTFVTSQLPTSWPDRGALVKVVATALSVLTAAMVVLDTLTTFVGFPYSYFTAPVRRWMQGGALYTDLLAYPFNSVAYGWLDYALLRVLWHAFGDDAANRLLHAVASAAWLSVLVVVAWATTKSWKLAVAAFCCMAVFTIRSGTADQLGSVLEMAAVGLWLVRPGLDGAILGGAIGGLATLGKQSYVAAVAGLLLASLLLREYRRGLVTVFTGAAVNLAVTGILEVWSGGAYLATLRHIAVDDGHSVWATYGSARPFLQQAAALLPAVPLVLKHGWDRSRVTFACCFAACFLMAAIGTSKSGASPTYFTSAAGMAVLLAVNFLRDCSERELGVFALVILVAVVAIRLPTRETLSAWKHAALLEVSPRAAQLRAVLAKYEDGPLLSEDHEFSFASPREVIAHDPHSVRRAVEVGRFDGVPLLELVEKQIPAVVILHARPFPEMLSLLFHVDLDDFSRKFHCAVWRNYVVVEQFEGNLIMKRRAVREQSACDAAQLPWWSASPQANAAPAQP
ncbi:MAG: hypothetical protein AB2A00_00200 [Myxococcota bacterium]